MTKDPFRYFRIEARELVDTLQRGIVALGDPPDAGQVRTLMRASHTLKGAAGVVRQPEIAKLAHQIEDLLEAHAPIDKMLPLIDAIEKELAAVGAPVVPVAAPAESAPMASESVRLDLAEVDQLLASLADLGARISAMRTKTGAERTAMLDGVERLAHDALEDARRLRLLPAETLFSEVARAAHDAAAVEGRLIEVVTTGGDRRLDAHVLGIVRDALLQLVRNAIAHGIEPAADRALAGKPKLGRISIRVEVHGARALIACRDDGRGLDLATLAQKLGVDPKAHDATSLLKLTLRAGVSTRSTASELAGRGVGLGVVGNAIEKLRGTLKVDTVAGQGTEIGLDVPVAIVAAPALLVTIDEQVITIPLDAITRTTRVDAKDVIATADGDAIVDQGETYRFGALVRVLGAPAPTRESWTALLTDGVAVGVDGVLGIANEVVHPLPKGAVSSPLVAGASLDGDGNPRLSLDPRLLADAVRGLAVAPVKPAAAKMPRILVTDDSLTSRMLEQSILEAAGYEVVTATSGEQALEKARQQKFALFVVDVEMPGITGFETVARMRADPQIGAIPAVLVTSRAAPEDKRRGLEAGARAYIVKGEFAQTEFLDTVRRLIG